MLIAIVATARKPRVLVLDDDRSGQDYASARPTLTDRKLRALELDAGMPARRGKSGTAASYALTGARRRELAPREQAEIAYRQLVASGKRKRPAENGRGCRQRDATQ